VIGGILIGPTLAVKVQWPVWLAILVVAVDGFLIVDVPYQFSEFFANTSLHREGWGSVADGMGAGCLLLGKPKPIRLSTFSSPLDGC